MKTKFVSYYDHNTLNIGAINLQNKTLSISIVDRNFEIFAFNMLKRDLPELIEILKYKLEQIK